MSVEANYSLPPLFVPLLGLGECEEDHGELLLGDLAVAVEVAPLHYRLLKVLQVRSVVILQSKRKDNVMCSTSLIKLCRVP